MKNSLLTSLLVAIALLSSACTTQNKKPPGGPDQSGSVTGSGGLNVNNSGSGSDTGAGAGHSNVSGAGSGSGSTAGGGFGGANTGAGSNNSGAGGGYAQGGGGAGGFGSGNSNSGGFGSGAAYGGTTKSSYTPADLRDPRSILAQRVIYFAYNQSGIQPEYRQIVDAHASLLSDFPALNVRLEGHADERGSREYNVALSEKRAFSVLDYMKVKGVKGSQADVVGYGEEIPATFGHGEGSWSKNRRVEIIYAGE